MELFILFFSASDEDGAPTLSSCVSGTVVTSQGVASAIGSSSLLLLPLVAGLFEMVRLFLVLGWFSPCCSPTSGMEPDSCF